jgi:hypothetical protein
MVLDNGKFLSELYKLYEANKADGSVWVTLKRSECRPRAAPPDRRGRPSPPGPCGAAKGLLHPPCRSQHEAAQGQE